MSPTWCASHPIKAVFPFEMDWISGFGQIAEKNGS
ncbi:hypothetical protein TNCV_3854471, partial [Trichonephila clavipes]